MPGLCRFLRVTLLPNMSLVTHTVLVQGWNAYDLYMNS